MSNRRARPSEAIRPSRLNALNTGMASSRTLAEALAIDQAALFRHVLPDAGTALVLEISRAQSLGILKRMRLIGSVLAGHLDPAAINQLAHHPSDTVRGWICFVTASRPSADLASLLEKLRGFADDQHFAVREWAWLAGRPALVSDLETSIGLLAEWTSSASERLRRFACEALRPRGVWATHIATLKREPDLGLPILHPLRADPSSYVQDSVANWINDVSKTCPGWATDLCHQWLAESRAPATVRIVRRALRSVNLNSARSDKV